MPGTQIHDNFRPIIGQQRAKHLLSAGITAAGAGRAAIQPFLTAPKGCGKSEIALRYLDALKAQGFRTMHFASPTEIRLVGGAWDDFMSMVMDYNTPYAVFFDECHEMVADNVKNMRILYTFIRKALDRTNTNRDIVISEEFSTRFNRDKNVIICATNFSHKFDASGTIQSRFDQIGLDLYREDELKQILIRMMTENEMTWAEESVLTIISRCGRGTARPIKNIVEQTLTVIGNDHPLTMDECMRVLKLMKIFPKGLTIDEVKLLQMCVNSELKDVQFLATVPSVEPAELRYIKGYLSSPGVEFMVQTPRGMATTNRGKQYLEYITTKGFLD